MSRSTLIKTILILAGFVLVAAGEHLFENLLQRRAKPIRWKWSNDLSKSSDSQRQRRFLPEETMVKWWKEMAPQKDARTRDSSIPLVEAYFSRLSHSDIYKRPRLTETPKRENEYPITSNRTQSLREQQSNFRQTTFDSFQSLSQPLEPFEKGDEGLEAENYLTPTEKTLFSEQYFPASFDSFQSIPQQGGLENEENGTFQNAGTAPPQHDIDSEFLREAIIHERHKPSKFEIQSATQRLRESERNGHFGKTNLKQAMSSVQYVVPSVEHVSSQVEYFGSGVPGSKTPSINPNVAYISPTVEFLGHTIGGNAGRQVDGNDERQAGDNDGSQDGDNDGRQSGDNDDRQSVDNDDRPADGDNDDRPADGDNDDRPGDGDTDDRTADDNDNRQAGENGGQFNATTDDPRTVTEYESPVTDHDIIVFEEEGWPDEGAPWETYESDGTKREGARIQIVGLRREQIRVRRNHRKNLQLGLPNTDYPTLEALPVLQFYCGDYQPGYYVDITTRCQVFHICHENGQRSSFLCPVGTVFNQEYLVCDWWYNVDCETSLKYYSADSLHAYGTSNERQRISTRPAAAKESDYDSHEAERSRVPFPAITNQNARDRNSNSRPPNLSQKAINYPVGYAILLREYMRNSGMGDSRQRDPNFERNGEEKTKSKIASPNVANYNFKWDEEEEGKGRIPAPQANLGNRQFEWKSNEKTKSKVLVPQATLGDSQFKWNGNENEKERTTSRFLASQISLGDRQFEWNEKEEGKGKYRAPQVTLDDPQFEWNEDEKTRTSTFLAPQVNLGDQQFEWNERKDTKNKNLIPQVSLGDHQFEWNGKDNTERIYFTPQVTLTDGTTGKSAVNYPSRNGSNVSEKYKAQSGYHGGSKPYAPSFHHPKADHDSTSTRYYKAPTVIKHVKPNIPNIFDITAYQNPNKSRTVLHASSQGEALRFDAGRRSSELEREKPINVFYNQKREDKNLRIKNENKPLLTNAKPQNKNPVDVTKYRFIINPSEAIIPAAKQYAAIEQHLKSNNSAIKFRHAESVLKHIKPKNSSRLVSDINRKTQRTNSNGIYDHRNYNLTGKTSKDNIASNSAPDLSKISRPTGQRYGERISIKSRSIPRGKESFLFNGTKYDTFFNTQAAVFSELTTPPPQRLYLENINRLKTNQNKNNYTGDSVPSESQSNYNFANMNKASDIFINNYRAEKEKTRNETESFYTEKEEKENDYVSDNRKITISVQIESKEVLMKDLNQNVSLKTNISTGEKSSLLDIHGVHGNHSSSYTINPQKDSFGNVTHSNKPYILNQRNELRSSTSVKPKNITKINNTYGGYEVVKMLSNAFMTSHDGKDEAMIFPVYGLQQNRTMFANSSMANIYD